MAQQKTSRKKMGAFIRKRLDEEHDIRPEGDRISQQANIYGHRKPYSGTQYQKQVEREKKSRESDGKHCPFCGKTFYITSARRRNIQEQGKTVITCTDCGQHFTIFADQVEDMLEVHKRWRRG